MRRFRLLNHFWAWLCGYFWLPCPICGEMYGGHEIRIQRLTTDNHCRTVCWRHTEHRMPT